MLTGRARRQNVWLSVTISYCMIWAKDILERPLFLVCKYILYCILWKYQHIYLLSAYKYLKTFILNRFNFDSCTVNLTGFPSWYLRWLICCHFMCDWPCLSLVQIVIFNGNITLGDTTACHSVVVFWSNLVSGKSKMGKQEFCGNFFWKTIIFIGEMSRQWFKMLHACGNIFSFCFIS